MSSSADDLSSLKSEQPQWFVNAMAVPRKQATVEVDGCPINYFTWGDPTKPGVVMVHGFQAHARCFAFIAPLLADQFYVAAMDFSGMGDSGPRSPYDADGRSEEIMAVARHAGMCADGRPSGNKPFIVGHSFGGAITTLAAEKYSVELAGIIVVDFSIPSPEVIARWEMEHAERIKARRNMEIRPNRIYPDLESALSRFRLDPEQPCGNEFLVEYVAHHSLKQVPGGWTWKFDPEIYLRDFQERNVISRIFTTLECRRALIYGELSSSFEPTSVEHLEKTSNGNVPVVMIPQAHHHIMLDQPLALASALNGFLTSWVAEDADAELTTV